MNDRRDHDRPGVDQLDDDQPIGRAHPRSDEAGEDLSYGVARRVNPLPQREQDDEAVTELDLDDLEADDLDDLDEQEMRGEGPDA